MACNRLFPCFGHISLPFPADEKFTGAIPANFASLLAFGNAQCSRFLTGCLPLRQYQFPASSSGYIESKAGCLLSPLPPPASVPGCKVVVTGSPSNPLLGGQIGLPCSSNHPPHHHRKSNFSDKEVQQSARWTASPALYLQFPIHQLMKFFLYIISSFYTYHWNRHIFLQKLINYFFYKESHSIDFCIIV